MFKLEHKNKNGSFKIKLNHSVSNREILELMQLVGTLIPEEVEETIPNATRAIGYPGPLSSNRIEKVYGPQLPGNINGGTGKINQTRLGQFPVESISMGSYQEPDEGVKIKFVSFPNAGKVHITKIIRNATGISLMGCLNIAYDNYPCPRLIPSTAEHILDELKKLTPPVYAKIVPGDSEDEA